MSDDKYIATFKSSDGKQGMVEYDSEKSLVRNYNWLKENFGGNGEIQVGKSQSIDDLDPDKEYDVYVRGKDGNTGKTSVKGSSLMSEKTRGWYDSNFGKDGWRVDLDYYQMTPRLNTETGAVEGFDDWREPTNTEAFFNENGGEYRRLGEEVNKPEYKALRESDRNAKWRVPMGMGGEPVQTEDDEKTTEMWGNIDRYDELRRSYERAREDDRTAQRANETDPEEEAFNNWRNEHGDDLAKAKEWRDWEQTVAREGGVDVSTMNVPDTYQKLREKYGYATGDELYRHLTSEYEKLRKPASMAGSTRAKVDILKKQNERGMANWDELGDVLTVDTVTHGAGPNAHVSETYGYKDGKVPEGYSENAAEAYRNYRVASRFDADTERILKANPNSFWSGGWNFLRNGNSYIANIPESIDRIDIRMLIDKLEKPESEGGGPDSLTKDEQMALLAWQRNAETHMFVDPLLSNKFKAGQAAAQSVEFMVEMALTGGIVDVLEEGALRAALKKWASKGVVEGIEKGVARKSVDSFGEGVVKYLVRNIEGKGKKFLAEQGVNAVRAIPRSMIQTALNVPMQLRSLGDNLLAYDEEGNLPSWGNAFAKGEFQTWVETYTENGIAPIWNVLTKYPTSLAGEAMRSLLPKAYNNLMEMYTKARVSGFGRLLRASGFQGLNEEVAEELAGALIYAIGGNSDELKDFFKRDNLVTLYLSFLPMTLIGGGVSMAQVGMAERNYNNQRAGFSRMLGDMGFTDEQIKTSLDGILSDPTQGHLGLLQTIFELAGREGMLDESGQPMGKWAQLLDKSLEFRAAAAQKAVYDGAWESEQNEQMRAEYEKIDKSMGNDFLFRDTYTEQGQEGTQFSADENGEAEAIKQGEEMADEVQDIAEEMADTEATPETRKERRQRRRAERRARREQGLEMSDDERAQRTIDSGRVCVVRTTDGRDVYVLGRAENGEWAVKDTKGGEMTFISDDQIERGDKRGEDGKVIKGEDGKAQKMTAEETVKANTQSLKQFLGARLLFNKEQRDVATERGLKNRANQVRSEQIQWTMKQFYKNGLWGGTFGKKGRYRVADAQTDTGTGLYVYDGKGEKPKLMSWDQIFKVLTGDELASEEMAERVMEEQRRAERGELPTPQEQREAEQSKTPLQKLPKDKNGDPIFEQAESPAQALDAIIEAVGDEQEGINMAVAQMNDATKAAQEASDKADKAAKTAEEAKTKPKGKTMNEKIAYLNKAKAEAERTAKEAAAAAKTAEFWTSVVEEAQNRSNAENTQQQTQETPQTQQQSENTQTESQQTEQTPQEQTQQKPQPQQKREKRKEEKKEGKRTERDEQRERDRKEYNEMCEAVRAELEKLNVPYRLITSKEEFLTMAKAEGEEFYQQIRSMLNHGTRTYGFARKGAVWIYAPQVFDDYKGDARMDKAKQTIAHEAIAHIGLKNMKDAEKKGGFVAFCKDVYGNVMSAKDRERYLAYQWNINMTEEERRAALGMTEKDGKTPRWEELTAEQRNEVFSSKRGESVIAGAADEYMAGIAEKIERGEAVSNEERTAWQRFMDWLGKFFGVKMNEHDIVDALLESRRRMEGGQTESAQTQVENRRGGQTQTETQPQTETDRKSGRPKPLSEARIGFATSKTSEGEIKGTERINAGGDLTNFTGDQRTAVRRSGLEIKKGEPYYILRRGDDGYLLSVYIPIEGREGDNQSAFIHVPFDENISADELKSFVESVTERMLNGTFGDDLTRQVRDEGAIRESSEKGAEAKDYEGKELRDRVDELNNSTKVTDRSGLDGLIGEITGETPSGRTETAENKGNEVAERSEMTGDEARKAGKWTVEGYEYTRQESHGGIRGEGENGETRVKFGNKPNETVDGHYVLVTRDKLQPSHQDDGQRNPMHFIPESQPKEDSADRKMARDQMATDLNPEEMTRGTTAFVGTPVINSRGEVVQGNNRAMGLKIATKESMERYHDWLKRHAAEFGFTAEQIDQMGDCVLVREVDVDDKTANALGKKISQDTESGGIQQIDPTRVSEGLQEQGKFGSFIESLLADNGDEGASLTDIIRANARDALSTLYRLGLVNDTQVRSAYNESGGVNKDTVDMFKSLIQSALFEGGPLGISEDFNNLPNNVQNALMQTAWRTIGMKNGAEVIRDIQRAIRAYREVGKVEKELAGVKDIDKIRNTIKSIFVQGDMFTGKSNGYKISQEAQLLTEEFFLAGKGLLYDSEGHKLKLKDVLNRVFDNMEGRMSMFEEREPMSFYNALEEAMNADASQRFSAEEREERQFEETRFMVAADLKNDPMVARVAERYWKDKEGKKNDKKTIGQIVNDAKSMDELNAAIKDIYKGIFEETKGIRARMSQKRARHEIDLLQHDYPAETEALMSRNGVNYQNNPQYYTDEEVEKIIAPVTEMLNEKRRERLDQWEEAIKDCPPMLGYMVAKTLRGFVRENSESSPLVFDRDVFQKTVEKFLNTENLAAFNFYDEYNRTIMEELGEDESAITRVKAKDKGSVSGTWIKINGKGSTNDLEKSKAKAAVASQGTEWCTRNANISGTGGTKVLEEDGHDMYFFFPEGSKQATIAFVPIREGEEDQLKNNSWYTGVFKRSNGSDNSIEPEYIEAINTLARESGDENVGFTLGELGYDGMSEEERNALKRQKAERTMSFMERHAGSDRFTADDIDDIQETFGITLNLSLDENGQEALILHEYTSGVHHQVQERFLDVAREYGLSVREVDRLINTFFQNMFNSIIEIEGDCIINDYIGTLGRVERIGGELRVNLSSTSPLDIMPNLTRVGGDLMIQAVGGFKPQPFSPFKKLTYIGGSLLLYRDCLSSLGSLTYVGGEVDLSGTKELESLGNLTEVGGFLDIEKSNIKSLGNLKTVGGNLDLDGSFVSSLGNVEKIGSIVLRGGMLQDLGNLKEVKSLRVEDSAIKSLGDVIVREHLKFYSDSSVPLEEQKRYAEKHPVHGIAYFSDGSGYQKREEWRKRGEEGLFKNWEKDGTWLYYDEDGNVYRKDSYKEGRLNGPYECYFHDGSVQKKGEYKDGRKNGVWEEWYSNGKLRNRIEYKNGTAEGLWESFYENGRKAERFNYKNGDRVGVREAWHPNGQRDYYAETSYDGNQGHLSGDSGIIVQWDEDGSIVNAREKSPYQRAEHISREQAITALAERGLDAKGNPISGETKFSAEERGYASAEERELSDADTRFSVTPKDEIPKKTAKGYKVFVLKDGKLYPPKVNPTGEATPVGEWASAIAAPVTRKSKQGRPKVKGTDSGSYALRPGWHLGELPYAKQFLRMDENRNKTLFPNDFVWAECEYDAGTDYAEEAHNAGINAAGNFQYSLASLDHLPEGGFYKYRTNPDPKTDEWIITDKMRVNRLLTDAEVDDLVRQAGREPQTRQTRDNQEQRDKWIEELNRQIGEKQSEENDDTGETVSDIENPENDTRFSATERVATADEARERFGVELTPDDLASTSTKHGAMMKALRIATENGAIPNMDSTELLSFLSDTWRNAPAEVKSSIWETFSESADPDIAREVEQSLAEYVSREVRGVELTDAQRTFLDDAAKTIADRLGISGDNAKYVLWQHSNANDELVTNAERAAMQNALGVTTPASDYEAGVQAETRYSAADEQGVESAREMYEKAMGSISGALSETGWNEYRALDDLVEAVSKQTGIKYNAWDPRKAFNQLTSNVKAATESYIRDYLLPMWDTIKDICGKRNVSADDLTEYVSLKHGLERNKVLYERDCEAADRNGTERPERRDYSGLTEWITDKEGYKDLTDLDEIEAAAQEIVDKYERTLGNSANALWDSIRAATGETLREQLRNGLITREMYDRISSMFEYYVPLQGFAGETNEDKYEYMGGYHDGRTGTVGKRAKGRKSRATNPFVRIGTNAERTIREAELNRAKNALYNFLLANSDNDLTSFGSVWYVKTNMKDERGREIWDVSLPPLKDNMSAEEMEGAIRDWESDMAALEEQGLAKREANRFELGENVAFMYNQDIPQHCIDVFVDGRRERIYIKGNPRAAQAVNGLLRTKHPDIERVFKSLSRYTSTIYTSGNPQFFVTNFARDLGFATFNVFSKEGFGYLTRFIGNAVRAAQIGVLSSKYKSGNANTDRKMQRLYGLFAQNGGITGYSQIRSDNHYQKEMERELGRGHWLWSALTFIPESFRRITEDGENLLRFAAFLTSYRDGEGKSLTDSIADAKDVTVNFNRKGTGRMISEKEAERLIPGEGAGKTVARLSLRAASAILSVGPAFSFFNVSMQGMAQLFRNIKQYPQRSVPALVAMVGMGLLNGIIHGCLNAAMGKNPPEPDDPFYNIPDWERRSNYIIMLGNGNYIKIPISQELRPFYALGDMIGAGLAHKTTQKDMGQEFLSLCGEMLPINPLGEGGLGQSLAPTISSPAVDLLINRDYRGLTIIPDTYGDAKAKWLHSYGSTPDWAVEVSRAINGIYPMGNMPKIDRKKFRKDEGWKAYYNRDRGDSAGWRDISPEAVQHLAEGYLGGLFTFASMCYETAEAAIKGEDVNMRRVPFVNRFYARPSDRETGAYLLEMNRYAKKLYKNEEAKMDWFIKQIAEDRDNGEVDRYIDTAEMFVAALYSGFKDNLDKINRKMSSVEDEWDRKVLIDCKNEMLTMLAQWMEEELYDNSSQNTFRELNAVGHQYDDEVNRLTE